jgi:hypothetical protein
MEVRQMKNLKRLATVLSMVFVVACCHASALGQSAEDRNKLATITATGMNVRWDVAAPHAGLTVTISAPDGQVFSKEFRGGAAAEFRLIDKSGERLPDGQYTYELRLTPVLSPGVKETLSAARAKGDDAAVERDLRKRGVIPSQPLVQSGSFSVLNGTIIVAGAVEEGGPRRAGTTTEQPRLLGATTGSAAARLRQHHARLNPMPDFVIADDLIVQGSACVGLDCINGEVFGFDTIRMKENNTRLQFDDTSATAGFATNNWQIRANSSASGGASFLAFVDQGAAGNSETGTIVFEVDAGAPANSLKVSSLGRIGLRTATPVLDLHASTGNTPAFRLEQNNSGGFTAQTWDIAGNEANFFVRDVTSGSRLPFRIRPGAPTSSLDIAATGNVGVGTQAPSTTLHVNSPGQAFTTLGQVLISDSVDGNRQLRLGYDVALESGWIQASKVGTNFEPLLLNPNGARVGIGTTAPDQVLSVNGDASKAGGGAWQVFSDERLKNIKGRFMSGLKAVMQLQPLRYEYKQNNALGIRSKGEHVGFGAQSLQQVIPEAVSQNDSGYLVVNNDPILWTMLNAIKEQQKEIEQLKGQIRQLRAASRKRR